jgi:hypothetical protein
MDLDQKVGDVPVADGPSHLFLSSHPWYNKPICILSVVIELIQLMGDIIKFFRSLKVVVYCA